MSEVKISNGEFIVGNSQQEVHQTRIKDGDGGHSLKWSSKEIWPSYIIEVLKSTFIFKIGLNGGLQGNTNLYGEQYSNTVQEDLKDNTITGDYYSFDPSGGTGNISFICRQSSYWHRVPLILRTTETININETTSIKLTNASDNKKETTKLNTLIREWTIYPSGWNNDETSIDYNDKSDFTLNFNIGTNNNSVSSTGKLEIIGFIDSLGEKILFSDIDNQNNILVFQWYQKPNIMFYVDMDFVQKPTAVTDNPIKATNSTFINPYDKKTFNIYLFVEFGISLDGGKTINWNQDGNTVKGISTKVPTDALSLPTFIMTTELTGKNADKFNRNINIKQLFTNQEYDYNGIYYKYFELTLNAKSENNENTNSIVTQKYYIDKKETNNTTSNGIEEDDKAIAYWTSKDGKKPISTLDFILRRTSETNSWTCNLSASLSYITDNLKYIGSTDPNK